MKRFLLILSLIFGVQQAKAELSRILLYADDTSATPMYSTVIVIQNDKAHMLWCKVLYALPASPARYASEDCYEPEAVYRMFPNAKHARFNVVRRALDGQYLFAVSGLFLSDRNNSVVSPSVSAEVTLFDPRSPERIIRNAFSYTWTNQGLMPGTATITKPLAADVRGDIRLLNREIENEL